MSESPCHLKDLLVSRLPFPLTADALRHLRAQASSLADCLYAFIRDDQAILHALKRCFEDEDNRSIMVVVALGEPRVSVELYHRGELAMTQAVQLQKTRAKARKMNLEVDLRDREAYIDAWLVPQQTWIFGASLDRTAIEHVPLARLYPSAFLLEDLENVRYRRTFQLDQDQLEFLHDNLVVA